MTVEVHFTEMTRDWHCRNVCTLHASFQYCHLDIVTKLKLVFKTSHLVFSFRVYMYSVISTL